MNSLSSTADGSRDDGSDFDWMAGRSLHDHDVMRLLHSFRYVPGHSGHPGKRTTPVPNHQYRNTKADEDA